LFNFIKTCFDGISVGYKLSNLKGINQLQGYLSFVQMINTEQFDKLTYSSPDLIQRIKAQCA